MCVYVRTLHYVISMREHFVAESKLQEIVLEIAAQKGDANRKERHGEKKVSRTNFSQTLFVLAHTHTHTHSTRYNLQYLTLLHFSSNSFITNISLHFTFS